MNTIAIVLAIMGHALLRNAKNQIAQNYRINAQDAGVATIMFIVAVIVAVVGAL